MTPRESYCVFPAWSSWFWTWLTGAALGEERPPFSCRATPFLLLALVSYLGGIALGIFGASRIDGWAWICVVLGWCLTVGGSRRLVSTVVHQCIHGRFSGRGRLDQFIGEWLTVLTFTQTAATYRREHFEQHHRFGVFATRDDPAAQFLMKIGFIPGRSVLRLWIQLFVNVVSPWFHFGFLAQRARSNFLEATRGRLVAAYAHLSVWCAVVAMGWIDVTAVALGAVVPVIFLYQLSVMFEFVSEHAWLVPAPPVTHARDVHRTHSWARFCGSAFPDGRTAGGLSVRLAKWVGWTLAHVLYHLPVRLLVLPGDLPQHDFHHRSPGSEDWSTAAYARQRYMRKTNEAALEFWGLHRAIHHVFAGLAAQVPPVATATAIRRNVLEETEV
jgi:fatty acid desaturase